MNDIRYEIFCKKLSSSNKFVLPENLPPTSDSARFHSYRVFHQVQRWKGVNLSAYEWGWIRKGNFLFPKFSSKESAPAALLKLIKCNCRTLCTQKSNCTCQKHGLRCSPMCGSCRGVSCCNHQETDD